MRVKERGKGKEMWDKRNGMRCEGIMKDTCESIRNEVRSFILHV